MESKKIEKKIEECIKNIEQQGADARGTMNNNFYAGLRIKLMSVKYWAERALRLLDKIQ